MIEGLLLRLAICAGLFLAGFGYGWMKYDNAAQVANLKSQVAQLRINMAVIEQDSSQAVIDDEQLSVLLQNTRDNRDALTNKDDVCFDADDANRLRNLWPTPAATGPR